MVVPLAVMLASYPVIFSSAVDSELENGVFFEQSITSRILWPMGFMLGFVSWSLSLGNITEMTC